MPFSASHPSGEPAPAELRRLSATAPSSDVVDSSGVSSVSRVSANVADPVEERALLEWSNQSVLRVSPGRVERLINAGFVSIDGRNGSADDFLSFLSPEEREMVITIALETSAVPGARAQCSVVANDPSGRRPLDLRFVNASADPRVGGLLLFVQDGSMTASSASELYVQRQISTFAAAFAAIKTSDLEANIGHQLLELVRYVDGISGSISVIDDGKLQLNTVYRSVNSDPQNAPEENISICDLIPNLEAWAVRGEPVTISTRSLPALGLETPRDVLVLPRHWPNGRIGILTLCGVEGFSRREHLPIAQSFSDLLGSAQSRQEAAAALHESELRHRALIANSPDHLVLLDDEFRITYMSPSVSRFFGGEGERMIGRRYTDFVHPDDRGELNRHSSNYAVRVRAGDPHEESLRPLNWRWIEGTIQDLHHEPSVNAILLNGRDVTDVHAAQQALAQQQRAAELVGTVSRRFAHGRTGDTELLLQETAGEMIDFIGASVAVVWRADGSGKRLQPTVVHPHTGIGQLRSLEVQTILTAAPTLRAGELLLERRTVRKPVPVIDIIEEPELPPIEDLLVLPVVAQNRLIGMVTLTGWSSLYLPESSFVALRSIAEVLASSFAKLEVEQTLRMQATTDDLTGLTNRPALRDILTSMLAEASANGNTVSVALLDLDEFKIVNDTLGHESGDDMLRAVGLRLRQALRNDDVLARLGGDEFVIAMKHHVGQGSVADSDLRDRLRDVFRAPFEIGSRTLYITASIGISQTSIDDPEATAEEMLRRADIAMYRAKRRGPGELTIFEEHMEEHVLEILALVDELRDGIENDQLEVWLQPIVQGSPGEDVVPVGVEALVRWRHPTRGLVYPAEFISIAEQYGLIRELGGEVLSKAAALLRLLIDSGELSSDCFVSVNVSTMQLELADFVCSVVDIAQRSGLEPHQLHIELTESMLAQQSHWSQLGQLRSLGFKLSIDDFGTGYSSLSYAREMPADTLKVDRSFVAGVAADRRDEALTAAVISMGNALGMNVIAEGVESEDQHAALASLGCTQFQGYYFARPMPLDVFRTWLKELNRAAVGV